MALSIPLHVGIFEYPTTAIRLQCIESGVIMLTKSLPGNGLTGVRVNSVSPGYIGTELTKKGMSRTEWYDDWLNSRHWAVGEPREVAASFCVGRQQLFTGSNLVVDGGYTCW